MSEFNSELQSNDTLPMGAARSLLIVEDDKSLLERLSTAMASRGFTVSTAASVPDGLSLIFDNAPAFAVVDMRVGDGNGLDVITALKARRSDARAVVLTGYGNIATAVDATKIGAIDYLAKPADADEVTAALLARDGRMPEPPRHPMTPARVRWEHIRKVFDECGGNVSETARRLNMHRRTLQRILLKQAPE